VTFRTTHKDSFGAKFDCFIYDDLGGLDSCYFVGFFPCQLAKKRRNDTTDDGTPGGRYATGHCPVVVYVRRIHDGTRLIAMVQEKWPCSQVAPVNGFWRCLHCGLWNRATPVADSPTMSTKIISQQRLINLTVGDVTAASVSTGCTWR